jgi:hypothetical protein
MNMRKAYLSLAVLSFARAQDYEPPPGNQHKFTTEFRVGIAIDISNMTSIEEDHCSSKEIDFIEEKMEEYIIKHAREFYHAPGNSLRLEQGLVDLTEDEVVKDFVEGIELDGPNDEEPVVNLTDHRSVHLDAPSASPSGTESPAATDSPVTESPITLSPVTQSPVTQSRPITLSPVTQSPITQSPITQSPVTIFFSF